MSESPSKLPPFPRPAPDIPELNRADKGDWSKWEQRRRLVLEKVLLPFWQGMAPVYADILADNSADDGLTLTVSVEDWPISFDAQQHALAELMDTSKLRQAWRSFAYWMTDQKSAITEGQMVVRAALEKEFRDSAQPMREVPRYWQYLRTSAQQVICMPVRQWDTMFSEGEPYEPLSVNNDIVEKLATRIARALNEPMPPRNDTLDAPNRLVVWNTNPGALLGRADSHGMDDRLFDNYLRPIKHEHDQIPSWRFNGFCGQLRVTGIGDEPWYVTVLAPDHFVGELVEMVRENEQ